MSEKGKGIKVAIKTYVLNEETKLTAEQMKEVEDAKKSPILYDEDSPELSDEELNRFVRVSKIRKEEFKQRA